MLELIFKLWRCPLPTHGVKPRQTGLNVVEARQRLEATEFQQNAFHPRPHQDPRGYVVQRQQRVARMIMKHGEMRIQKNITFDSLQFL